MSSMSAVQIIRWLLLLADDAELLVFEVSVFVGFGTEFDFAIKIFDFVAVVQASVALVTMISLALLVPIIIKHTFLTVIGRELNFAFHAIPVWLLYIEAI